MSDTCNNILGTNKQTNISQFAHILRKIYFEERFSFWKMIDNPACDRFLLNFRVFFDRNFSVFSVDQSSLLFIDKFARRNKKDRVWRSFWQNSSHVCIGVENKFSNSFSFKVTLSVFNRVVWVFESFFGVDSLLICYTLFDFHNNFLGKFYFL